MRCNICQRPIPEGWFEEQPVTDGERYLCAGCARMEAHRIYNKLRSVLDENSELYRKAFATYGIDDFANSVEEEINNG